jgi:hypothetical protein
MLVDCDVHVGYESLLELVNHSGTHGLGMPHFEIATGRCAVHPRLRVRRYQVRTEGDELVVSLR